MYSLPPNIMRRPVEEPAREPATEPLEGTDGEPVGEPWAENGTIVDWLSTGVNPTIQSVCAGCGKVVDHPAWGEMYCSARCARRYAEKERVHEYQNRYQLKLI